MGPTGQISRAAVRDLIAEHAGGARVPAQVRVLTDTTNFLALERDDVVVLGGRPFWVRGCEREGRFGLDEEPKHWVRRAIDLGDGSQKVLKLVFHERFEASFGGVTVTRFRSPRKEARILDLVRGHPAFMQGRWVVDGAGNTVRILDYIRGRRYDELVLERGAGHRDYFERHFPAVLAEFVELVRAVKFLHDRGEKHGDIRRDHVLWDRERDARRWIDFDYNYLHGENMFAFDLQGLGAVLIFLAGRGDVLVPELARTRPELLAALEPGDVSIAFRNRVANLRKVYPYVPEALNRVLLHFSGGARVFYDTTDQLLDDLQEVAAGLAAPTEGGP